MTRRILLVLLAFTAAVIVGAGVPLAMNAIAHDRSSFTQNAVGTVRTYAAVVQQRLNDVFRHGCNPAHTPGGDIRLVSRQEIVERAWDEHWYGPTKVLDVHMAALRRKLGDPGLIETVYGHGFRLADLDGTS